MTKALYQDHFGIRENPFSIIPDPHYLYMSARHQDALAHLLYGIGDSGGFVLLTGEVGTGKTTVCRALIEQLPDNVDLAMILNPRLSDLDLMAVICDEMRISYPPGTPSLKTFFDILNRHLLDAHARGRNPVLMIDEAQSLPESSLELVRLLTNLETAERKLLQIILVGQPELNTILAQPHIRQTAQRITARYHLDRLDLGECRAYIRHRLKTAGITHTVFAPQAVKVIHRASGGIPRLINSICDRALLGAYTRNAQTVSATLAAAAASEVMGRGPASGGKLFWVMGGTVAALAGFLIFASLDPYDQGLNAELREFFSEAFHEVDEGFKFIATRAHSVRPPEADGDENSGPDATTAPAREIPRDLRANSVRPPETPAPEPRAPVAETPKPTPEPTPEPMPEPVPEPAPEPQPAPVPMVEQMPADADAGTAPVAAPVAEAEPDPDEVVQEVVLQALIEAAAKAAAPADTAATGAENKATPANTPDLAFGNLFGLWGVDYTTTAGLTPCDKAAAASLLCVQGKTDLRGLRVMNRPAVIPIAAHSDSAAGPAMYGVVRALGGDTPNPITVMLGDGSETLDADELAQRWSGEYLLLWRRDAIFGRVMAVNAQGDDVAALSALLSHAGFPPADGDNIEKIFGAGMKKRVQAFQASRGLNADGIVGTETLLALTADRPQAGEPRLTAGE